MEMCKSQFGNNLNWIFMLVLQPSTHLQLHKWDIYRIYSNILVRGTPFIIDCRHFQVEFRRWEASTYYISFGVVLICLFAYVYLSFANELLKHTHTHMPIHHHCTLKTLQVLSPRRCQNFNCHNTENWTLTMMMSADAEEKPFKLEPCLPCIRPKTNMQSIEVVSDIECLIKHPGPDKNSNKIHKNWDESLCLAPPECQKYSSAWLRTSAKCLAKKASFGNRKSKLMPAIKSFSHRLPLSP